MQFIFEQLSFNTHFIQKNSLGISVTEDVAWNSYQRLYINENLTLIQLKEV